MQESIRQGIALLYGLPLRGVLLGVGLAILGLAWFALARTRWGQSRPLQKCAALSVLVYALLGCLAMTIRMVGDTAGGPAAESFRVTLLETSRDAAAPVPAPRDAPWDAPPGAPIDSAQTREPRARLASQPPPPAPRTPQAASLEPTAPPAAQGPRRNDAAQAPRVERVASTAPRKRPLAADPVASDPVEVAALPARESTIPDATAETETRPLRPVPRPPTGAADVAPRDDAHGVADADQPTDETPDQPLPGIYRQRSGPARERAVRRHGGGAETESAVEAALAWLAANQSADGRWDADRHGAGREERVLGDDRQGAGVRADTGITGLALLAYLGAGQTHLQGPHRATVRGGLEFLLASQASDGDLGGGATLFARMYCHGMATFALCEAYAMTGDARLHAAAARAVGYTVAAQHAGTGGWRYRPGEPGDMSQCGWQLMALKSGALGGIGVPPETLRRTERFLQSVSGGRHGGLGRYRPHQRPTAAMTAERLFCLELLGRTPRSEALDEARAMLLAERPGRGPLNLYGWYYATLALFQLQGEAWETWNVALKKTLLPGQRQDGPLAGSWDPDTVWGGYGGRVYSTALATLSLEVYYRYLPVYEEAGRLHRRRR